MIANEIDTNESVKSIEDEINANEYSELLQIKGDMKSLQDELEEIDLIKSSKTYENMIGNMRAEYQRLFNNSLKEDDAHKAKYCIEQMRGIGFCMGVLESMKNKIDEELNYLTNEVLNYEKN